MKKTFQKIWYTFSVILIIAGMVLVLPGAIFGGDGDQNTTDTSTSIVTTPSSTVPVVTSTTASGVTTTTAVPTETSATLTTVSGETTTTATSTTVSVDTTATSTTVDPAAIITTTTASGETTTTTALTETPATSTTILNTQNIGSVILTRISNGAAVAADFYLKDSDGKYYTLTGKDVLKENVLAKQSLSTNGVITWTGLPPKTYKIEIDPISGYISAATPDTFTIDSNNITQLVTLNITSSSQETTTSIDAAASKVLSETIESTTTTLPADTTPPVIVLTGDEVINLIINETFKDPGATATDNVDASVAVTSTSSVDTSKVGSYKVSYDAVDAAGNAAATVTRKVKVADLPDTTPPVIVLTGDTVINLNIGETFTDPGATATDNLDKAVVVTTTGLVETDIIGTYTLTYDAIDTAGNKAATTTRIVKVADLPDTTPPVITLTGDAVINLKIGDTFTDPGAIATDNKDKDIQVAVTGTVNTNFASSYTINYNAIDTAGNMAATVTRIINITSIATIFTDKPDYIPTEYVLVTGSGWLPGETVQLDFHETLIDLLQQTITYTTIADSSGNIRDIQYLVELRHYGASFVLNATGQTSGLTAQTTFTDSKQIEPTFDPPSSIVTAGTHITIISSGAQFIYYTMDGTVPSTSEGGSTFLYDSTDKPEITNQTTTLNAIAIKSGKANSSMGSATYLISPSTSTFSLKSSQVDKPASSFGTGDSGGLPNPYGWHFICNDLAPSPTNIVTSFTAKFWDGVNPSSTLTITYDDPSHFRYTSSGNVHIYVPTPADYYIKSATLSFAGPVPSSGGEVQVSHVWGSNNPDVGSIEITKHLIGLTGGSYTFSITANDSSSSWSHEDVIINLDGSSNNSVLINNIPLGSYTVTEIFTGGEDYRVTIPSNGSYIINLTQAGQHAIAAFTNAIEFVGKIKVQKDIDHAVSGVDNRFDFKLYKNEVLEANLVGSLSITINGGTTTGSGYFENLEPGNYIVVETAASGWTTMVKTSVDGHYADGDRGSVQVVGVTTNSAQIDPTVYFKNTKIETPKGKIIVHKATSDPVVGDTIFDFRLYSENGDYITTKSIIVLNGHSEGSVTFTNLESGTYTVVETTTGWTTEVKTTATGNYAPGNSIDAIISGGVGQEGEAHAYFRNTKNYSVSVYKATIGTGFNGSFTFALQKLSANGSDYDLVTTLEITSLTGGTASFSPIEPLTAGIYRVIETRDGGATNTNVSNSGIPVASTTIDNAISSPFILSEMKPSQTVYFVNSIPSNPPYGSIMIVKNVTVTQGANTTFNFTITPAVNGISDYNVVVPANQPTGTFTINGVPFGTKYSISENLLPDSGWILQSPQGLTFTLNAAAALATPVFTNTPTGGGTTTTVITVAGISTGPESKGGIQVLGISNLPFTGSRDTLFKFGMVFIIFGLMMMIFLPIFLRAGKHMRTI